MIAIGELFCYCVGMKLGFRTFLLGLLAGCVVCGAEQPLQLGRIMFVGDSITHGFGTSSYRWPLHKILVDNGVQFVAVGVTQDNLRPQTGTPAGTKYAGVPFNNRHSAMSSGRAYEVAGRMNHSGRLGNSNIYDWLGLDTSYTGKFRIDAATEMPDVFVLLIGTNDTFSDYGRRGGFGLEHFYGEVKHNLLSPGGDMDTIVAAMRQANPAARILLLSIPTWHDVATPHSHAPADYVALNKLNAALAAWAADKNLEWVDVNRGLVDVTRADKPGVAEPQFFSPRDGLHPTDQGDMLIAAEVARALGVGGRTVGLERKPMADFPCEGNRRNHIPLEEWRALEAQNGLTVAVKAPCVGNGAVDGWSSSPAMRLCVCRPDLEICGILTMTESDIRWNENTVLYCGEMSKNAENLRVAWVPGNEVENRSQGFYVWLGERLIGEALPSMPQSANCWVNGALLTMPGAKGAGESPLRAAAGAWAPPL